jgi:hypothetical protein
MAGRQDRDYPNFFETLFAESVTSHPTDGLAAHLAGRTLAERDTTDMLMHLRRLEGQASTAAQRDWVSSGTSIAAVHFALRYGTKQGRIWAARRSTHSRLGP